MKKLILILVLFFCSSVKAQTLQELIDTPSTQTITIPSSIYLLTQPLILPSYKTINFEPGTLVEAASGAFVGISDSLMVAAGVRNLTINATGTIFRMRKDDYSNRTLYPKSEFRHCLDLRGSIIVNINGGRFESSGGDGIYIGPLVENHIRKPCLAITISNVICDNNYRQGISVLSARGLLIKDCILSNTRGTSPQAGIDIEPEWGDSVSMTVMGCVSDHNRGAGFMIILDKVSNNVLPIRIAIIDSQDINGYPDQVPIRFGRIFSEDIPRGYLHPNLPKGSLIQLDKWIWKN